MTSGRGIVMERMTRSQTFATGSQDRQALRQSDQQSSPAISTVQQNETGLEDAPADEAHILGGEPAARPCELQQQGTKGPRSWSWCCQGDGSMQPPWKWQKTDRLEVAYTVRGDNRKVHGEYSVRRRKTQEQ